MTADRDAVRSCRPDERDAILGIVDAAAEAYRGVVLLTSQVSLGEMSSNA